MRVYDLHLRMLHIDSNSVVFYLVNVPNTVNLVPPKSHTNFLKYLYRLSANRLVRKYHGQKYCDQKTDIRKLILDRVGIKHEHKVQTTYI
jgi:hypothetical protein